MNIAIPVLAVFLCLFFMVMATINFKRSTEIRKRKKVLADYINIHEMTIDDINSGEALKLKESYKKSFLKYQYISNLSEIGIYFIFILNILSAMKVHMLVLVVLTLLILILLFIYLTKIDVYKKYPFIDIESNDKNKKARTILTKIALFEFIFNFIALAFMLVILVIITHS